MNGHRYVHNGQSDEDFKIETLPYSTERGNKNNAALEALYLISNFDPDAGMPQVKFDGEKWLPECQVTQMQKLKMKPYAQGGEPLSQLMDILFSKFGIKGQIKPEMKQLAQAFNIPQEQLDGVYKEQLGSIITRHFHNALSYTESYQMLPKQAQSPEQSDVIRTNYTTYCAGQHLKGVTSVGEMKSFSKKVLESKSSPGDSDMVYSTKSHWKVAPVPTCTYRTANFQTEQDKNTVLYSGGAGACVVMLVKNYSDERKKYDNVVTMAHFFPNNAFNEATAKENIDRVLAEYKEAGGTLTKNTSIQLLGGLILSEQGQTYKMTAKSVLEDTLKLESFDKTCKVMVHESSQNFTAKEGVHVFVNRNGTQILKTMDGHITRSHLITKPDDSMPENFLKQAGSTLPQSYEKEAGRHAQSVATTSKTQDAMALEKTVEAFKHIRETTGKFEASFQQGVQKGASINH